MSFCSCVFSPFSISITSLGEEKLILVLFVRLFSLGLFRFVGLGRAAVCDCGTPWTFLLPFFLSCAGLYCNVRKYACAPVKIQINLSMRTISSAYSMVALRIAVTS